jgi:hypothetical protein
MRIQLREALAAAREYDDALDQTRIIKEAVTKEVRALDPTISPHFTEYFNNSVVPDIVLRWPNEDRERFLFVRPSGSPSWLLNEIRLLSPHHPLVFTLEDIEAVPEESDSISARQALEAAATTAGIWITDPSGTEAMSGIRTNAPSPPVEVLSQALVRGGRGISDGEEIRKLTTETERGFASVAELSIGPISSAVETIERHLNKEQAGRLTRLLRALWEAGGGDAARFPQTATLGRLNEDDLSYILRSTSGGSEKFWRGVGHAITTEMLGRVRVDDYSNNLQAFMLGNLEILQAKGMRFIDEAQRIGEPEQTPRWIVDRGCLALRGLNWTAYVAARRIEEFPPEDSVEPPSLTMLRKRASLYRPPITQIQLGRDDRAVTYESNNGRDVLGDPELNSAEADFRMRDIEGAEALLAGGGRVEIEFRSRTATGRTSATFPVGSLMRSSLPLLTDFSVDEFTGIREILADRDALFTDYLPFDEQE